MRQPSSSDWDNEELKNLADQIPEHLAIETDRAKMADSDEDKKSGGYSQKHVCIVLTNVNVLI